MDEFKPEDELKPDPSDRRTGRSRQASDRVDDPQINFDDVDVDGDDRRSSRSRRAREEHEEEGSYAEDEDILDEDQRRPRKRKKPVAAKPASRQYLMMGIGILVLLLLIIGIGSALKAPAPGSSNEQNSTAEKNIDLSGDNTSEQATNAPEQAANAPQQGNAPTAPATENAPRDVTLPPISSSPSQAAPAQTPEGQQRVELPGDLNTALSQPQGQEQVDNAVGSTLPTEPATVAPVRNGNPNAAHSPSASNAAPETTTRPERKRMVIEPKPQAKTPAAKAESTPVAKTEPKPAAAPAKRSETAPSAPAKAPAAPAQPKAAAPAATSTASGAQSSGNVSALKSAPASNYTLQLSSSSNYNNLNAWAKKANLKNFVVYQTTRNGQPWYVLVSGVYTSKDEAKRAVSTLPADVQAKNPWAKPLRQVQADLK